MLGTRPGPAGDGRRRLDKGRLKRLQIRHALDQQPVAVDSVEPPPRRGLGETVVDHQL